ncbi:hypothetical protein FPV67DRAFT_56836 [Lyophyllum atratum]|nr:hypothetical protein FPV67DRAFT_56836 [Lyophyllum atratum]
MDTLLHGSYNSCEFHAMRDALLTAVAVSGRLCGPGEVCVIEEQIFWDLATRSECTNFIAASSFAHRVMVTEYRSDDLSLAEAWCYLRDVLLLILSRRFAEDDEALALLVCPVLCSAMAKMVQTTSSAVNFILSSPWTMSLCSELRSLIAAEYSPDEQYYSLLQQRLREAGRTFLDQIAQKLQRSTVSIVRHSRSRLRHIDQFFLIG